MILDTARTIVVVDDDSFMQTYLSETLTSAGYSCRSFGDGASALGWLTSTEECVVLLLSDINMPGMNGLDLLRTIKTVAPTLPFILISGVCDLPMAKGALRAGATDYLLKPVRPADLINLVSRHLDSTRSQLLEAVKVALQRSFSPKRDWGANLSGQLSPIFDALGFKRFETLQHSRRVSAFALLIARDMGMDTHALKALEIGSLLHDVGKAGIPHNVLMKPGKLNAEEWAIMEMHPRLGMDLLAGLHGLDLESQIVYSHHERFDGTGYPERLVGEAIPLHARVFSIADTLDALTSDRCYRAGQPQAAARVEIHGAAGSQFDRSILEHFDHVEDWEFEAVRTQFPDAA